jgi:hypothetical protein
MLRLHDPEKVIPHLPNSFSYERGLDQTFMPSEWHQQVVDLAARYNGRLSDWQPVRKGKGAMIFLRVDHSLFLLFDGTSSWTAKSKDGNTLRGNGLDSLRECVEAKLATEFTPAPHSGRT